MLTDLPPGAGTRHHVQASGSNGRAGGFGALVGGLGASVNDQAKCRVFPRW